MTGGKGMRVAVASGKGGAGKTTVAASLALVWDSPCVVVDADVEAPNLHLFMNPQITNSAPINLPIPILDQERCTLCGACRDVCRFKAIAKFGQKLSLFPDMCHGCGGCFAVCPEGALLSGERRLGDLDAGTTLNARHGFIMGRARIGEAMTPPQLRALRSRLDAMLECGGFRDALLDAPPGVSCPAMTVARDVDVILLAVEPTPFGFHDFKLAHRAFQPLEKHLAVVINRIGMPGNQTGDRELRDYCLSLGLPVLAELPFDRAVAEHYAKGQIIASLSLEWHERFTALRDALRVFWSKELLHA